MKKTLLTLLVLFLGFAAFAQNIPPTDGLRMETDEDYRNADSLVIQVSKYFLSIPLNSDNYNRLRGALFLKRWMAGSPEFNIVPNSNFAKYTEDDVDLLSIYYSSLCLFVLQNPGVKDANTVTLNAARIVAQYVGNPENHVILTRRLTKLVAAEQKDDLKSFLKL
jgi:hypothetical protein